MTRRITTQIGRRPRPARRADRQGRTPRSLATSLAIPVACLVIAGTGTAVAADLLTGADIQDDSLTHLDLGDNSVRQPELAAASVGTDQIQPYAITNSRLGNLSVSAQKIATDGVTRAKIAADAIDATKIADDSVRNEHIQDDSIGTAKVANGTLTGADLGAGTVGGSRLTPGSVDASRLAGGGVTSPMVVDNSLRLNDLASDVRTVHIADSDVGELFFCRLYSGRISTGANAVVMPVLLTNLERLDVGPAISKDGIAQFRVCNSGSKIWDPPAFDVMLIVFNR